MNYTYKFDFRYFWTGLGLLLAALLLSSCGQAQAKNYTIGIVNLAPPLEPVQVGFREKMVDLGYTEGENVTYIYDGPVGSIDGLEPAVQKLLEQKVDLILALTTPVAKVAQNLTQDTLTPVVFAPITDPVNTGLVETISQPGGNLTGVYSGAGEARRFGLLLELDPTVKRVYIPHNPEDASAVTSLSLISEVAEKAGVELMTPGVSTEAEIFTALQDIPEDMDAMFLLQDGLVAAQIDAIAAASIKSKIPLSTTSETLVERGAFMSYGADIFQSGYQAAEIAHQILSGSEPAAVPVRTTEFVLTVNLKTAEAIDFDIPDDILRQADIVIR